MARRAKINWANILTWSRLIAIVPLSILFVAKNTSLALFIYILAIITDLFDGPVARLQKMASAKGAAFDGAVDHLFILFCAWWIYLIAPEFYTQFWLMVSIAVATFVIYFIILQVKVGKPLFLHLWSGKLAAVFLMLLIPVVLTWGLIPWYVNTTLAIVTLSSIEGAIYVLQGNRNADAKVPFSNNSPLLVTKLWYAGYDSLFVFINLFSKL